MKKFLEKILKKCTSWLGDKFANAAKWLNDELFNWLPKVLKGLGFTGFAAIVYDTIRNGFDESLDRFSFFARLFQIDDLFDLINDSWSPYLSDTINTTFIGACNAFGIIASINEIINTISWSLIIWVFLWVLDKVFKFVSAAAAAAVMIPK